MRLLATLIAFGSAPLSSTEEAANALQKRATERVTTRNRRPFYAPLSSDYEFPLNLTTPGYEGGVRPDAGDDSVLRAAIARALADPTYNLTILVIGGSEPQGSECKDDYVEGVVEAGVYVWWNNFPIYGRTDCPWPARLAQYLLRLLPHRNFVIVNGAMGGCGSGCFLGKANVEIGERTQNEPRYSARRTLERPIGNDVDLVLIDWNANDGQTPNCSATALEALLHLFLVSGRFGRVPTIALLDVPSNGVPGGEKTPSREAQHRPVHVSPLRDVIAGSLGCTASRVDTRHPSSS